MNFKQLVNKVRGQGDLPMATILRRCRCSSAMFYFLRDGVRGASPRMVAQLAQGLGVSRRVVEQALAKTRKEAMLS